MRESLIAGVLLVLLTGANLMQEKEKAAAPASQPSAYAADRRSIDTLVAALYDVISGPAGKARDWDRLRALFTEHARMIAAFPGPDKKVRRRDMSVEDYITLVRDRFEKDGFFEKEVARHADTFGPIAQVFSTYESRKAADDKEPFARGINSIQITGDGDEYRISAILWCGETGELKIPDAFRK